MNIFSHRGNCREALENSMSAFDLSFDLGIHGIELDTQVTADGDWIIMHDETLDRTTNATGYVRSKTGHDISKMTLKNNEPIPLLADVLKKYTPQCEINIEIKDYSPDAAYRFAEFYRTLDHTDKLLISAISQNTLRILRSQVPDMRLGLVLEYNPFLKFAPILKIFLKNILKRVTLESIHPNVYFCSPSTLGCFKSMGLRVNAWFPLKREEKTYDPLWEKIKTYNLDGLITNEPRAFKAWWNETGISA